MSEKYNCCHVIRIEYDGQVKFVRLKNAVYSIGRSPKNAIVIDHHKVSREHCLIVPATDEFNDSETIYYLVDGNLNGKPSSNGLFVDLKRWTLKHQLRTGDVVGIGTREVSLSYYKFSLTNSAKIDEFCMLNGENKCSSHPEMSHIMQQSVEKPEVLLGKDFILLDS